MDVIMMGIIVAGVKSKIIWMITEEHTARIAVIASVVFENAGYIRMARIYPAFFCR